MAPPSRSGAHSPCLSSVVTRRYELFLSHTHIHTHIQTSLYQLTGDAGAFAALLINTDNHGGVSDGSPVPFCCKAVIENICMLRDNMQLLYRARACEWAVVAGSTPVCVCVFVRSQVRICWRVFEVRERQASGWGQPVRVCVRVCVFKGKPIRRCSINCRSIPPKNLYESVQKGSRGCKLTVKLRLDNTGLAPPFFLI